MADMTNPSAHVLNQRGVNVEQVMRAWPADRPLVMLHSAGSHKQWGRWSVLSSPSRFETVWPDERDPLGRLPSRMSALKPRISDLTSAHRPPFTGGWIGYFSYELGRAIEPAARHDSCTNRDSDWPLIELAHCPAALVHDNLRDTWHAVGDPTTALALIDQLDFSFAPIDGGDGEWRTGDLISDVSADAHLAAVARTLEYIAAGDIFQANITQQLHAAFAGCTRSLARHALGISGARYGAYMELPDGRCIVSMSPELFLHVDAATRCVTTRPIKGTRPHHGDVSDLMNSAKDAAELNMITDLMRNDLGRVCEYGSITVADRRSIESHPTVHHGVSTITGRLRDDVDVAGLLAATFPGGSVTGAPKIRAMQIIEELEPQPRGIYCGAIGMISNCGNISLNVAIRTMLLRGRRESDRCNLLEGTLTYGAGGGIVADSDPLSEYRECMDKTAVLRMALRRTVEASRHEGMKA
jgi:para-aminobenzoate synthetase component 1